MVSKSYEDFVCNYWFRSVEVSVFFLFFFFSYAVFLPVLPAFPVFVNIAPIKTKLTQFLYVASFLFHPSFEVFLKKENVEENSGKWGAIFRGHPGCTFG